MGGQFEQNGQKLHEDYKIDIFGAKQWRKWGTSQFWGSGGYPPVSPLGETWVLKALFHEGCYCHRASAIWLVMKIK